MATGATRIADDIDIVDNELNSVAVRGNPLLRRQALTTLMTNMLNRSGLNTMPRLLSGKAIRPLPAGRCCNHIKP